MTRPITLDDPAAYFERLAAFEATHWWSAATWRVAEHWLDAWLRGKADLEAIDVGCGAGADLVPACRATGNRGGRRDRPEPRGAARVRCHDVVEASAIHLPFAAESFDVATCLDVIQHVAADEVATAMGEVARVLRPGGVAVVRTNAGRHGLDVDRLRATFEAVGFRVHRSSRVNGFGSLAQEVRGRLWPSRYRAHPSGGGLPAPHRARSADRIMAAIGRAEAYVVGRLGWRLPFGHSAMMLLVRGLAQV